MDMEEVWRQLKPLHDQISRSRAALLAVGVEIIGVGLGADGKIVITVLHLTPAKQRLVEERFPDAPIRFQNAEDYYRTMDDVPVDPDTGQIYATMARVDWRSRVRHPIRQANNLVHRVLRWRRQRWMRKLDWQTSGGPVAFDEMRPGMMSHAVVRRGRFRRRRPW